MINFESPTSQIYVLFKEYKIYFYGPLGTWFVPSPRGSFMDNILFHFIGWKDNPKHSTGSIVHEH